MPSNEVYLDVFLVSSRKRRHSISVKRENQSTTCDRFLILNKQLATKECFSLCELTTRKKNRLKSNLHIILSRLEGKHKVELGFALVWRTNRWIVLATASSFKVGIKLFRIHYS